MKNEKGLMLIEWMVIAAIFSVLAIVIVPQFAGHKTEGLDDQAISALEDLTTVQAVYFRDHNEYTDNWDTLAEYGWQRIEGVDVTVNIPIDGKNYMMEASHIDSDNTYRVTRYKRVALKQ